MKISAKTIRCDCGGTARKDTGSHTFRNGGVATKVDNIPALICDKCGEIYFDGPSILKIERRLEKTAIAV